MMLQRIVVVLGVLIMNVPQQVEPAKPFTEMVHVSNTFHFEIPASLSRVAPLFGPEAERGWAGKDWNPEFLYPWHAKDTQGAVFRIQHGQHSSVWVNTLFDLSGGRMQYVAFLDELVVTTVDVKLTATDSSHTTVEVTYARTALQPEANGHVQALGSSDRESGPDWQQGIETCLGIASK